MPNEGKRTKQPEREDRARTVRESDCPIVVRKRGNARGAKGTKTLSRGEGKHRPGLKSWGSEWKRN